MHYTKGRILGFEKGNLQTVIQGVGKNSSLKGVRNQFGFDNGYGGFHLYGSNPYLNMHICLFRQDGSYFHADIEIRDFVLAKSGRQKITETLLEELRKNNVGKKLKFFWNKEKESWEMCYPEDLVI